MRPRREHALRGELVTPLCGREQPPERGRRIGGQLGVGRSGFLEVEDVEELVAEQPPEGLRGRDLRAGHRGQAQPGHGAESLRMQQRCGPGHHRAEVVAHQHGLLGADSVEQPDDVGGQFGDVVGLDRGRPVGAAVAALVGGQYVVAGVGQAADLVAPGEREFGKAVTEYDHRCARFTGLGHPQAHPVGGHHLRTHSPHPTMAGTTGNRRTLV